MKYFRVMASSSKHHEFLVLAETAKDAEDTFYDKHLATSIQDDDYLNVWDSEEVSEEEAMKIINEYKTTQEITK